MPKGEENFKEKMLRNFLTDCNECNNSVVSMKQIVKKHMNINN
jgi:hypothetical protein